MKLKYIETHSPIFTCTGAGPNGQPGGINWGVKLYERNPKGQLELEYSPQNNWVEIQHGKEKTIIPMPNIVTMWPKDEQEKPADAPSVKNQHVTEDGRKRRGAQVSTPHGHVFDGEGAGKTRDK